MFLIVQGLAIETIDCSSSYLEPSFSCIQSEGLLYILKNYNGQMILKHNKEDNFMHLIYTTLIYLTYAFNLKFIEKNL
jgi:hypothetical protein